MANPGLKKAARTKNSFALQQLFNLVVMAFCHLALTKSVIFGKGVFQEHLGGGVRLVDTLKPNNVIFSTLFSNLIPRCKSIHLCRIDWF